jgi:hypothetical protein
MSDNINVEQDELNTLKGRADLMGISYHPSIGVDKLREKVKAAIEGQKETKEMTKEDFVKKETLAEEQLRLSNEANALVRIRLSCMNPAKREWEGEIFTVGNSVVGSIKKYVPFNAEEGWHVPRILYQMLQDRQCQTFTTEKTKNGVSVRKGKMIKEFNIEVLPQLTPKEIAELARRQAMAAGTDA